MTDFSTPTNSSLYTGVLTALNGKIQSTALMDYSSDTNLPTGAMRFDNTTKQWDRWSGSAWVQRFPEKNTGWTPSYGGIGSMTYTSVTTNVTAFVRQGSFVYIQLTATGTTGGTASKAITVTLPFTSTAGNQCGLHAQVYDPSYNADVVVGHAFIITGGNTAYVYNTTNGNWSLGAGRLIYLSGWYPIA